MAVEISKIIIIIINVIFLIFGIAALGIGIAFKVGWDKVRDAFVDEAGKVDLNLQNAGDTLAIGGIVLGVFIILVSLFGLIGACCKVRCLLVVYAIIVLILLIAELVVIIYVAVNGSETETKIKEELVKVLDNKYEESSGNSMSKAWSALFNTLGCCGVNNVSDFSDGKITFKKSTNRPTKYLAYNIPITCCKNFDYESTATAKSFDDNANCLTPPADPQYVYTTGCVQEIKDRIDSSKGVLIGVGVTILVIEILAIILSFCLCSRADE